MKKLLQASLALAVSAPFCATAQSSMEAQALRREIEELRQAYEARLQALERRLDVTEAQRTSAASPSESTGGSARREKAPSAVESTTASTESTGAASANAGNSANAFNPAVSLILSGTYTRTSRDPADYSITGFRIPEETEIGPGARSFHLGESELLLSASVDPWFRGLAAVALSPDNSVSVEEAYVQTTALGNGFSLKAGRFFSGIGYLNARHAHTWDFVDNPLAYHALLGTQFGGDGLQLTWVAPAELFIEFGAELGRGGSTGNGAGMRALTAHVGGDVGVSHSWRAGLSALELKDSELGLVSRNSGASTSTSVFTGKTRTWVADAVWKWAPNGNPTQTNFTLQGEYLRSTPSGSLSADVGSGRYRITQSGWYLQGVYQFMPRWRVGLRTDRLDAGTPDQVPLRLALDTTGFRPSRNTVMLDFSPSEFSRWRVQFARDQAHEGVTDNQVFVQYQMSLGAHGAHSY